jgi:hypothetical protein
MLNSPNLRILWRVIARVLPLLRNEEVVTKEGS